MARRADAETNVRNQATLSSLSITLLPKTKTKAAGDLPEVWFAQPFSYSNHDFCKEKHNEEEELTGGHGDDVPELQVLDGEVDDGWVLLSEEAVADEALDMQHQEGGQPGDAEAAAAELDVVMHALPVKFLQQFVDGHLRSWHGSGHTLP